MNYISSLLLLIAPIIIPIMAHSQAIVCDPETGICSLPPLADATAPEVPFNSDTEIIYLGDPMCSWCWGISPALHQLEYQAAQEGIPFRIVVGGLRPGGGDPWNEQFQNFLRHHWEEVNARSGQPFSYELFERESFHYDTEPSCRAVVTVRSIAPELEHRFYELVQHYFYVRNEDPNEVAFYKPICETLEIDFDTFSKGFQSEEMRQKTIADFQLSRQWGISGFPTVLLRQGQRLTPIARGYATYEQMWERVSK